MFTKKAERHVEARALALDWLRTYDALLKSMKDPFANPAYAKFYDSLSRPGKLTDEERAELAYERSIKHQPQWKRHPYA